MGLQLGDNIPEFTASKDDEEYCFSAEIIGKAPYAIYFYPKNFTLGCIKETFDFIDSYEDLKKERVISSGSIKSNERFKNSYRLPFIFLSDIRGEVRKLFGVKLELFGLLREKETYVIDQNEYHKTKD